MACLLVPVFDVAARRASLFCYNAKIIRVYLTGELSFVSAKDVILESCGVFG